MGQLPNSRFRPNRAARVITTGPDGNLWFTEEAGKKLGCIVPGGDPTGGSAGSSGGTGGIGAGGAGGTGTPAQGTFPRSADMAAARANHTATLLKDGTVFIAGGYGNGSGGQTALASAEIFHPDSLTFTSAGTMTVMRAEHAAVLLADGKVLWVGGYASTGPSSYMCGQNAGLFDPSDGSFTATSPSTGPRCGNTATLLTDGRVLICANGIYVQNADLFDPATRKFSATGKMTVSRIGHTATLLPDGRVLIAGGVNTIGTTTLHPECLGSQLGEWQDYS